MPTDNITQAAWCLKVSVRAINRNNINLFIQKIHKSQGFGASLWIFHKFCCFQQNLCFYF